MCSFDFIQSPARWWLEDRHNLLIFSFEFRFNGRSPRPVYETSACFQSLASFIERETALAFLAARDTTFSVQPAFLDICVEPPSEQEFCRHKEVGV